LVIPIVAPDAATKDAPALAHIIIKLSGLSIKFVLKVAVWDASPILQPIKLKDWAETFLSSVNSLLASQQPQLDRP
jgi:hypothetical protein